MPSSINAAAVNSKAMHKHTISHPINSNGKNTINPDSGMKMAMNISAF